MAEPFQNTYETPGWQRARANRQANPNPPRRSGPMQIEGTVIARSGGEASRFAVGTRVFHQKFGYGRVVAADGNKLTVDFEHSGEKRVVDSFLEQH